MTYLNDFNVLSLFSLGFHDSPQPLVQLSHSPKAPGICTAFFAGILYIMLRTTSFYLRLFPLAKLYGYP